MKKDFRKSRLFLMFVISVVLTACSNVGLNEIIETEVRQGYEEMDPKIMPTISNSQVGITDRVCIPSPEELEEMEDEVIRLLNEYRVENGLNELEKDDQLTYVARIRAEEIVTTWSHIRPDGTKYVDILDEIQYPSPLVGENLARGQLTPARAMEMWKESPSHNENMLIDKYTKIGVGVYVTEDGKLHYVQIFAQ